MAKFSVTNIFKNYLERKPPKPIPEKIWKDPFYFIAFGFGIGSISFAPGTFATLLTIPFYLVLSQLPLLAYLIIVLAFTIFSIWLTDKLSREINIHDHPGMCLDEFVGFLVTMINAPFGPGWILLGVLLFRIFDIWKPWPIRKLDEDLHGGFGMILDDVLAGIFSMVIIQIMSILFVKII